jgi:hypothetical protein
MPPDVFHFSKEAGRLIKYGYIAVKVTKNSI